MTHSPVLCHKVTVCSGVQLFVACQRLRGKIPVSLSLFITFVKFILMAGKHAMLHANKPHSSNTPRKDAKVVHQSTLIKTQQQLCVKWR